MTSEFVHALRTRGARISPKLVWSTEEGLRQMQVREEVKGGEELAWVPRTLWLGEMPEMKEQVSELKQHGGGQQQDYLSPAQKIAAKYGEDVQKKFWQIGLAARLVEESRVPGSLWEQYVNALPPHATRHHPIFFAPKLLEALQYPVSSLVSQRQRFIQALNTWDKATFPLPDLAKAFACVASRAFDVGHPQTAHASESASATADASSFSLQKFILPLIDMANHCFEPSARKVFDEQRSAVQLVAARALRAHSEITIDYGHHSNDVLFADFGFLLLPSQSPNPYDKITAVFNNIVLLACLDYLPKICEKYGLALFAVDDACVSEAALGFTLSTVTPSDESLSFVDPKLQRVLLEATHSHNNDGGFAGSACAVALCTALLSHLLHSFPTTLSQDLLLLQRVQAPSADDKKERESRDSALSPSTLPNSLGTQSGRGASGGSSASPSPSAFDHANTHTPTPSSSISDAARSAAALVLQFRIAKKQLLHQQLDACHLRLCKLTNKH